MIEIEKEIESARDCSIESWPDDSKPWEFESVHLCSFCGYQWADNEFGYKGKCKKCGRSRIEGQGKLKGNFFNAVFNVYVPK